jgi:hypothetical protein
MPNSKAPEDKFLDQWVAGKTRKQIMDTVRRPSGQKYASITLDHILTRARANGDERAVYRRKPTGRRKS